MKSEYLSRGKRSENYSSFKKECAINITKQASDVDFVNTSSKWLEQSIEHKYSYNFEFLGRPIIQYPTDILATLEIIFQVKPSLIIETGIAHGGSLICWAAHLCLLDLLDGADPRNSHRKVLGIDVDLREHNRKALEQHPLKFKIDTINGSSVDTNVVEAVDTVAANAERVMVILDSNHSHEHVLKELELYSEFVSVGSYLIVFDTCIQVMPDSFFSNRPWGVDNNAMTALKQWLPENPSFEIDSSISNKLMISVAPDGYVKRRA